jgi:hypothetical protein
VIEVVSADGRVYVLALLDAVFWMVAGGAVWLVARLR